MQLLKPQLNLKQKSNSRTHCSIPAFETISEPLIWFFSFITIVLLYKRERKIINDSKKMSHRYTFILLCQRCTKWIHGC